MKRRSNSIPSLAWQLAQIYVRRIGALTITVATVVALLALVVVTRQPSALRSHPVVHPRITHACIPISGTRVSCDRLNHTRASSLNDTGTAAAPTIAFDGDSYGLAWTDIAPERAGIFFVRLSATGARIGSQITISRGAYIEFGSQLVWTGSEFGLTWTRVGFDNSVQVMFARVSRAGALIGSPQAVTPRTDLCFAQRIAWDGKQFGLAWFRLDSTGEDFSIDFARLSPTGSAVGRTIVVRSDTFPLGALDVIPRDDGFSVAAAELNGSSTSLGLTPIDAKGAVGSTLAVARSQNFIGSVVAVPRDRLIALAWEHDVVFENGDPVGRIAFALASHDRLEIPAKNLTSPSFVVQPALAVAGNEYGASWAQLHGDQADLFFARVTRAGDIIGTAQRLTAGQRYNGMPTVIWTGSEFAVAWTREDDRGLSLFFARISRSGERIGNEVRVGASE